MYTQKCLCAYRCVHTYICVYMCMCAYMCIYIYIMSVHSHPRMIVSWGSYLIITTQAHLCLFSAHLCFILQVLWAYLRSSFWYIARFLWWSTVRSLNLGHDDFLFRADATIDGSQKNPSVQFDIQRCFRRVCSPLDYVFFLICQGITTNYHLMEYIDKAI